MLNASELVLAGAGFVCDHKERDRLPAVGAQELISFLRPEMLDNAGRAEVVITT